ncbi:MAG: phosphoenolpyruvate kinase [Gemmatimonadetes bacterium]|nr:phosphoenolpyruvate kinase [Gemmatimonadota bacterium]
MKTTLPPDATAQLVPPLERANLAFAARYPGESGRRQPVHTVYGGGHLFRYDSAAKLGARALGALEQYAPDAAAFARALGLPGAQRLTEVPAEPAPQHTRPEADAQAARHEERAAWLAETVYARVLAKLRTEPVEDFRIDFEDGYGHRPDPEEDGHAAAAAAQVARGLMEGTLPPFIGIRIKPLTEETRSRAIRTLDVFLSTLLAEAGGALPPNFVITLPKVTVPEQIGFLADVLELLEPRLGLEPGSLHCELMIETPQAVLDGEGRSPLLRLAEAGRGRVIAAHFGTYDYTAACGITAAHQQMRHAACDFAKHMMQAAFAGTGIWLSDGSTAILPVPPHRAESAERPLTREQVEESRATVHRAWRLHYQDIQHSLVTGFYQGWDLHPAQLPTRYAAVYAFFLDGLDAAGERLRNFVGKAAQATLLGQVFDDAATGQGLLNFFLRAVNCGAVTEAEAAQRTGLTLEEVRGRSFMRISRNRRPV